jgi:hypothetical protein
MKPIWLARDLGELDEELGDDEFIRLPGRPREDEDDEETLVYVRIGLTPRMVDTARRRGRGNLSLGVRILIRKALLTY